MFPIGFPTSCSHSQVQVLRNLKENPLKSYSPKILATSPGLITSIFKKRRCCSNCIMKIAVEGCAHGELDKIYSSIKEIEEREKIKIDLLICCGDFQSSRNVEDLACMAVPPKYRHICTFYKYFSGEKKAPVLTIFIGGNHEASNYLQELPYGGWVAPNIYYMGYASVINVAGVRIGGISGIYKSRDYMKGRYEKPPYDENSKRSVYHIRNLEVFRLKQLSQPIDIFLSHDWPTGVYHYGNVQQLLRRKPFFKDEIDSNQLGSKPCEDLLKYLKPKYWFSAHLHCKFAAVVPHENNTSTKFLALDKCLPKRQFLQVVEVPHAENKKVEIEHDLEWLTILYLTNHLLNFKNTTVYMPGPGYSERYNFTPSEDEKSLVLNKMHNTLKIPKSFRPTAPSYQPGSKTPNNRQPEAKLNPQTVELCELLDIDDPICLICGKEGLNLSLDSSFLENSTFISFSDDSDGSGSDADSDELKSDVKKLSPMKLPQPKVQEETEPNKIKNESGLNEDIAKISPKRILDSESKPSHLETDCESSSSQKNEVNDDLQVPKKFKRRNASIYGVETSDS